MWSSFLLTMQQGGPLMWVILVVAIATSVLIVERCYVYGVKVRADSQAIQDHLLRYVEQDQLSKAMELISNYEMHPFATMAKAALIQGPSNEQQLERAMAAAMQRLYPVLIQRTELLGHLGSTATLLGLLGTVMGLMESFLGMGEALSATKQEILARGIATALTTTAFGLIVGLIATVASMLFFHYIHNVLYTSEARAKEFLNLFLVQHAPVSSTSSVVST